MQRLSAQERHLLDRIDPARMLERTLAWSAINSGTGNLAGLATTAQMLAEACAMLPGEVSLREPAEVTGIDATGQEVSLAHGRHLVVEVRPEAPRRVLLSGHMDTVYPAQHPFSAVQWLDAETVNGPGVADMKGGIAVLLEALLAFEASPAASLIGYDILLNSDEETGSLSSAPLIAQLAQGKLAALTYEPAALPDGTLAHARGGSGNFALTVHGRSAHAGRNPGDGRNAVVAAAALTLGLAALAKPGLTINPARIDGGSANNVVPDLAVLRFNIRPQEMELAEEFLLRLAGLIAAIEREHEVTIHCHGGISRPPKPVDTRAQQLFDLVQACGAQLGQRIGWQPSGGVCDGNNIAACGVPVVDTLGVRGGAIHSPQEYLIVPSLAERAQLSALILHRLATKGLP